VGRVGIRLRGDRGGGREEWGGVSWGAGGRGIKRDEGWVGGVLGGWK